MKFKPQMVPRIWGGHRLYAIKQQETQEMPIGETWEVSSIPSNESIVANGPLAGKSLNDLYRERGGEIVGVDHYSRYAKQFPLLIKMIDACDDLSIQVHPDDALAQELHSGTGKTEMWYVVDAAKDASLLAGFKQPTHWNELLQSIEENRLTDLLAKYPVKPGSAFFLPAGCVHAIGKGALIVEIQQSSDHTYRIFDYGRKDDQGNARELHLKEAQRAIDFENLDSCQIQYDLAKEGATSIVDSSFFKVNRLQVSNNYTMSNPTHESFKVYVCIGGSGTIQVEELEPVEIGYGESVLLPAALSSATICAKEEMSLLEVTL